MQTSVREIHFLSEPDSAYFLRVDRKGRGLGSGFQVMLTDGQEAWRGEVSESEVSAEASELEMSVERYVQDLHQALTETQTSNTNYSFTLTPSPPKRCSTVTLAYEKVQRDISFRLGCVLLAAVPDAAQTVRELLTHTVTRGRTLQTHNQEVTQENERLRGEQLRIAKEMQRYVGGKETLEAELYSRFVLVLNEKKSKIRSLQETVTKLEEHRSERQTKGAPVKSGEDEYEGSTDEEERPTAATSSTPASIAASPLVDNLADITDVAPCRKRRFRHIAPPEPEAKKTDRQTKRADPPPGSSKQQETPQRPTDQAAAEDLFDDF